MRTRILLSVVVIVSLAFSVFSGSTCSGETRVYDRDRNLKYRVDESGRIYDKNWNLKGRQDGDRLYDRNWNRKGHNEKK